MSKKLEELSPEAQRQRQAIYVGLTSVLNPDQANAALESWSIYFNETGSVFNGLNTFARDVCESFDIGSQQRDLVKALNRALLSKDSSAPRTAPAPRKSPAMEDTGQVEVAEPDSSSPGSAIMTPEFQTFQYLVTDLLQLVENNRSGLRRQAVDFLKEVVESMPWSEAQQQQMTTLLTTGNAAQTRAYRGDQLKSLLKHFRSWMTDEIGANVAGNLLKQALQDTEKTSFGIRYSPTNFV